MPISNSSPVSHSNLSHRSLFFKKLEDSAQNTGGENISEKRALLVDAVEQNKKDQKLITECIEANKATVTYCNTVLTVIDSVQLGYQGLGKGWSNKQPMVGLIKSLPSVQPVVFPEVSGTKDQNTKAVVARTILERDTLIQSSEKLKQLAKEFPANCKALTEALRQQVRQEMHTLEQVNQTYSGKLMLLESQNEPKYKELESSRPKTLSEYDQYRADKKKAREEAKSSGLTTPVALFPANACAQEEVKVRPTPPTLVL